MTSQGVALSKSAYGSVPSPRFIAPTSTIFSRGSGGRREAMGNNAWPPAWLGLSIRAAVTANRLPICREVAGPIYRRQREIDVDAYKIGAAKPAVNRA